MSEGDRCAGCPSVVHVSPRPCTLTPPLPPRRPPALRRLPRVLQLAAKALFQLLTMLWLLLVALPRPDVILLQVVWGWFDSAG